MAVWKDKRSPISYFFHIFAIIFAILLIAYIFYTKPELTSNLIVVTLIVSITGMYILTLLQSLNMMAKLSVTDKGVAIAGYSNGIFSVFRLDKLFNTQFIEWPEIRKVSLETHYRKGTHINIFILQTSSGSHYLQGVGDTKGFIETLRKLGKSAKLDLSKFKDLP